jgi:hypothetical protein
MKKYFSISIRIAIGFLAAIIAAGGGLEGGYLTWTGGVALALFTTVRPEKFRDKINISYWLVLIIIVIIFLAFSYIDATNGIAANF